MLVFSILLVTTCGFYTSTAAILVEDVGIGRMTLSDYILTEDLLWMSPCSSLLRCAVACVDDDRCVGFTVTRLYTTGKHTHTHTHIHTHTHTTHTHTHTHIHTHAHTHARTHTL